MTSTPNTPPSMDHYYMGIAVAVRERANCQGTRVGALVVKGNRIVSTGYNGTPSGMVNCLDGGCRRCAAKDYPSGSGYDLCICVHAEQNAIVLAARHGNSTSEGTLYTTLRPGFGCAKEAIPAGIREIVFAEPYEYDEELEDVYRRLHAESGISLRQHTGR